MSGGKQNVEKLIERIDELLVVLNRITEDLSTVSASLKSLAVSQLQQPTPSAPSYVTPEFHEVEDIKMMFPEDLENLLSFEEKGEYIMIKPRQFLGSENFAKIASVVRGIGGDYVSAGRDSHFRVPRKRT